MKLPGEDDRARRLAPSAVAARPILRIEAFEVAAALAGPLRTWTLNAALTQGEVLRDNGHQVGMAWEDELGRWCRLAGVLPTDALAPRSAQFADLFAALERGLETARLEPGDLVRTWFVLDPILLAYAEFNRARNEFFQARGFDRRELPASTAVGGPNPWGASVVAGAVAVRPRPGRLRVSPVSSPLQGPASAYGSAFSRATRLSSTDGERLLVSGTASIGPDGESQHPNDPEAQVERTLTVVDALLDASGFEPMQATSLVAYAKAPWDPGLVQRVHSRYPRAGLWWTTAQVCREELAFELELEARKGC